MEKELNRNQMATTNSRRTIYAKKVQACMMLSNMNKKKITSQDIRVASKVFNIGTWSVANAWRTFQESGGKFIDYRVRTEAGSFEAKPSVVCKCKSRDVSFKEAGSIIVEYMTDREINSRELCIKHNISVPQFYSWIRELDVSGTLLGRRVLDPKKYAKLIVKDVIWFKKRPDTQRKSIMTLSAGEIAAYKRVATVLEKYLSSSKTTNVK